MRAAAEAFRTELGPVQLDTLREALHEPIPPADMPAAGQMHWVADNLAAIGEGLTEAGLPTGFNTVYAGLSYDISLGFDRYTCQEVLGGTAVKFEGHYREPARHMVDYLDGRDESLELVDRPWQLVLLRRALLRAPHGVQAGMGMLTHIISNDLMGSLHASDPPPEYEVTFKDEVGAQIDATIDRLAPELVPGNRIVRGSIISGMKRMIRAGRSFAWDRYVELKDASPEDRERAWVAADRNAALLNRAYLIAGPHVIRAARVSELLPPYHRALDTDGA